MALSLAFADQGTSTYDVSTLGPDDWFVYPNSVTPVKKTGTPKMAVSVLAGSSGPGAYNSAYAPVTWSGGTPTASGSTNGGTYTAVNQSGEFGWTITAPAGTGTRTVKLFVGAYLHTLRIRASLSDGSAAALDDSSTATTVQDPERNKIVTITYSAASNSQTLTITLTGTNSLSGGSSISMRAAALTVVSADGGGGNAVPTFTGTIANISGTAGTAITNVNVSSLFSDTDTLTYSASPDGAAWPSGLSINSSTGVISGTVASATTVNGIKVRATDTASQTVDSNAFNVTIAAAPTTGNLLTDALTTSGTLRPSGTTVYYTLLLGGQIGTGTGTATHGTSTLTAASKLSLTGLTAGNYLVWMRFADGGVAYQEITVS